MESENNFPPDFLSQAHLDYVLGYIELEEQTASAVIDNFLSKERG